MMIAVKLQLFINGRYAHKGKAQLDVEPYSDANRLAINELFRGALTNLDPTGEYEVKVTRRDT